MALLCPNISEWDARVTLDSRAGRIAGRGRHCTGTTPVPRSRTLPAVNASELPPDLQEGLAHVASKYDIELEQVLELVVESALHALDAGTLELADMVDPCESPRLVQTLLRDAHFGFTVSGDRFSPEEAEAVVDEELRREGLPAKLEATQEFAIGRGYGITTLLLAVAATFGGVVGFFKGLKVIDDGAAVLAKWIRAVRRAATRLEAQSYTASFVEGVCVQAAIDAGVEPGTIDLPRVVSTIQHIDIGMEADVMTGHWTVTVPTTNGTAMVFIVDQQANVLTSAQLGYPELGWEPEALPAAGDAEPD